MASESSRIAIAWSKLVLSLADSGALDAAFDSAQKSDALMKAACDTLTTSCSVLIPAFKLAEGAPVPSHIDDSFVAIRHWLAIWNADVSPNIVINPDTAFDDNLSFDTLSALVSANYALFKKNESDNHLRLYITTLLLALQTYFDHRVDFMHFIKDTFGISNDRFRRFKRWAAFVQTFPRFLRVNDYKNIEINIKSIHDFFESDTSAFPLYCQKSYWK